METFEASGMEADAEVAIGLPTGTFGSPIATAALCTLVFNLTSMVESKLFVRGNNNELSLCSFLN